MAGPSAESIAKTLYIGDLAYWMDENYLYGLFAHTREVTSVRLIRNKATGASEGYGFIDFCSRDAAERVLRAYNGQPIPNTEHVFKMNWASVAGSKGPPPEGEERPSLGKVGSGRLPHPGVEWVAWTARVRRHCVGS